MPAQREPLAWGRTVADADALAAVAGRTHFAASLPAADRIDAARFAIVTALLEAVAAPGDRDLLAAGRDAISRMAADELRHLGLDSRDRGAESARFARWHRGRAPEPWEDALIEAMALRQIWGVLPARYCRDLQALADHGGYQAAARALGTTDATFRVRIGQARVAFRAWWHEHEAPSRMWGADRRAGHPRARAVAHVIRARQRDRARASAPEQEAGAA